MVQRKEYLEQLIKWKDELIIKVVTSIRRCEKSTLLEMYKDYLLTQGISENQIIYINFEELEYEELLDYKKLYSHIKEQLIDSKMTYVFFDEIQQVENYQKAIDSLYVKKNIDLYITGSNAYLLSSKLTSLLSERYIEIKILPLKNINDNYPKTVLTLDRFTLGNYDGISVVNDKDWLFKK